MNEQLIDIALYAAYILVIVAIIAAVFMNLFNSLKNPKSLIKSGIGIVALVVIFFIGYSIAPAELDSLAIKAFEANKMDPSAVSAGNVYKMVGGALTTTFALLIIAFAGVIFATVSRIVK